MKKNKGWLLFPVALFFCCLQVHGQVRKYVIFFRDKAGGNPYSLSAPSQYLSHKSIQRRIHQGLPLDSTDLPVTPAYLNAVRATGAQVLYPLKWLNGAIIESSASALTQITSLPFVQDSKPLNSRMPSSVVKKRNNKNGVQSLDYGISIGQNRMVDIDSMHAWGFHGEGLTIALLDGGYENVNQHEAFQHLFQNNRILAVRDLVDRDGDVYADNWHGAAALSNIAAYLPGKLIGGAYGANFILIRSEDVNSENEIECAYWVAGLEYADSLGADIVNSSLGYTTFDTPSLSYSYSSLDGITSIASRAASRAASKGILVLTSAGNEGNNSSWGGWISVPGDADSILTVGSVGINEQPSGFSGKGPTADGRIKPDLVAQGSSVVVTNMSTTNGVNYNSGTSFSCPIVCGLAAGFWQAHPDLTAMQVIHYLKNSGSNHESPNNFIGWGIPGFVKAHILAGAQPVLSFPFDIHFFPNPTSGNKLTVELLESATVGKAQYSITDAKGSLILESILEFDLVNQQRSIELPKMRPGIYFITLEMGGKKFFRKLVLN